jgi:hypothetical protein
MPDEKHYVGTLLELDKALLLLPGFEAHIMKTAYIHWQKTVEIEQERLKGGPDHRPRSRRHSSHHATAGVSNSEPLA